MKVYVVSEFDWDYSQVVGVFSSYDEARKFITEQTEPRSVGLSHKIEDFDL